MLKERPGVSRVVEVKKFFWHFLLFLSLKFEVGSENSILVQKLLLISKVYWVI